MPLEVIGAGYPRTGTMSLKLALEQLGFGPCHHMVEVFAHPEQWPRWSKVFDEQPIDWDEVYEGYRSGTDAPTCFFYRELSERYPNAKFVLSKRSGESWWKSAQATVMSPNNQERMQGSPMASVMMKFRAYLAKHHSLGLRSPDPAEPPDRDQAIAAFHAHNEDVERHIPPARLLVFEAKQGWEPLCKFLGVAVPDAPYPHVNSTEDFGRTAPAIPSGAS